MDTASLSHYIAGHWSTPKDEEWDDDVNPSDARQVVARVPGGSSGVADQAMRAAQSASVPWRLATGPSRGELLHRAANILADRRRDIGTVIASEVGKPVGEALAEVDRGVVILRYFAEEAVHPIGDVIPAQQAGSLQFTLRQPLGPVAVITPWNFPVAIPLWKIAPALAYGNTIVWKPAGTASLSASRLVQVFADAGFPAGVVNLVLGRGSTIGDPLISHPSLRGITFTGSEAIGMAIAQKSAQSNIKCQLEMGGKNAVIVLPDADVDQAAQLAAAGAMRYAGQKCTATSRAVVATDVIDQFIDRLTQQIQALPLAPATDPASAVGPLISQDAVDRVSKYAEEGARGGRVVLGGRRPSGSMYQNGFFFEPTVIVGVSADARVAQEEVFGPLLVLHEVHSIEEAIAIANGTRYGLSVSLFTRDIDAMLEYIPAIECGMVRVNGDTTGVDPHAPFGGMRASSSHSREQGRSAVEFFTDVKTVQINPTASP